MTDVERFWDALRVKWPTPQPSWHELNPHRQMMIMQSLQIMIQTMEMPNE